MRLNSILKLVPDHDNRPTIKLRNELLQRILIQSRSWTPPATVNITNKNLKTDIIVKWVVSCTTNAWNLGNGCPWNVKVVKGSVYLIHWALYIEHWTLWNLKRPNSPDRAAIHLTKGSYCSLKQYKQWRPSIHHNDQGLYWEMLLHLVTTTIFCNLS
jgi:hypothetical protein